MKFTTTAWAYHLKSVSCVLVETARRDFHQPPRIRQPDVLRFDDMPGWFHVDDLCFECGKPEPWLQARPQSLIAFCRLTTLYFSLYSHASFNPSAFLKILRQTCISYFLTHCSSRSNGKKWPELPTFFHICYGTTQGKTESGELIWTKAGTIWGKYADDMTHNHYGRIEWNQLYYRALDKSACFETVSAQYFKLNVD